MSCVGMGWYGHARDAMNTLAHCCTEFNADDLRLTLSIRGVGEPPHPNYWGRAFSSARAEGLIQPCGYRQSAKASRRGGIYQVWTAA
jgi:hypothetical protein